jgi:hypothetical protein
MHHTQESSTRRVGSILWGLAFAAGCATPTSAEPPAQGGNTPATAANVTSQLAAAQQLIPEAERKGLDAPVVWHASRASSTESPAAEECLACGMDRDRLSVTEVRADSNWLYLDVTHKAVDQSPDHSATAPIVRLRANGCAVAAPQLSGSVWRNWDAPSTLVIGLSNLPDGELDMTVTAFGVGRTIALKKSGKAVVPLATEQRAGYRVHPADSGGPGPTATLGPMPNCAQGGTP